MIRRVGDVAENADRSAQGRHDEIHPAVVVQISIREPAVRRWPRKVGPSRCAHIFKLPVPAIAKDRVWFGVAKMP